MLCGQLHGKARWCAYCGYNTNTGHHGLLYQSSPARPLNNRICWCRAVAGFCNAVPITFINRIMPAHIFAQQRAVSVYRFSGGIASHRLFQIPPVLLKTVLQAVKQSSGRHHQFIRLLSKGRGGSNGVYPGFAAYAATGCGNEITCRPVVTEV